MPILHWLNDEEARKKSSQISYRLLEPDPELSFGDAGTENMLIQGDNLEALKALLPYYAGQVKCIFIDPPYNTRSAFEHYDDSLEHSTWLSAMYPRLEMLHQFLSDDGSIWISIDDNEGHYLKVLMDEVFGRKNFVANVIWQKKYSPQNDALFFSEMHDHILVFSKNLNRWTRNLMPRTEKQNKAYKNPDKDSRGLWKASDLTRAEHRDRDYYGIETPAGKIVFPARGRSWSRPKDEIERLRIDNRLWFGNNGDAIPSLKRFLSEVKQGVVPVTLWLRDEVGDNQDAKKEVKGLNSENIFDTPKPEKLIQRILEIGTNPNDLVLDSFLGSGTTAAVAHKMGRRYIGIEMGEHAVTHCAPRLKKVIEGEQGGISKEVNWQGGGGFKFYRLGEPIFNDEGYIGSEVNFKALATHIWFSETHTSLQQTTTNPFLGVHGETAYYLLYNDDLGGKANEVGNVLTAHTLRKLPGHKGKKIIYGEMCMLDDATLQKHEITFKHIPYDIKAR